MRDHELEQLARHAVLVREREDGAEHEAVGRDDVERAEAEEHADHECEDTHGDVVREDAHREHRRRRHVQDAFGPEPAFFDAVDHRLAGDQPDQLGILADEPPSRRGAQREQQRDQLNLPAQLAHDLRNLVLEQ